jgi:hypothetical protein
MTSSGHRIRDYTVGTSGIIPRDQDGHILGRDAMKPPRLPIYVLLIFVAVVALNLAVVPALWAYARPATAIIVIALQIGFFFLVRGRSRSFWAGFLAAGSLSMASCFLASPPQFEIVTTAIPSGGTRTGPVQVRPGSMLWHVWESIDGLWVPYLEPFLAPYVHRDDQSPETQIVLMMAIALIQSLPHWLIALAVGLVSQAMIRRLFPVPPDPLLAGFTSSFKHKTAVRRCGG